MGKSSSSTPSKKDKNIVYDTPPPARGVPTPPGMAQTSSSGQPTGGAPGAPPSGWPSGPAGGAAAPPGGQFPGPPGPPQPPRKQGLDDLYGPMGANNTHWDLSWKVIIRRIIGVQVS